MRYQRQGNILKAAFAAILLILIIVLFFTFSQSPSKQAMETVEMFYEYEQQGDFSQSWELFHSHMQDKFSKGHYIQDRAHVFMNHFDVTTFSFTLDKPEKMENWQMEKDTSKLDEVYKVNVISKPLKGNTVILIYLKKMRNGKCYGITINNKKKAATLMLG
ncbi:hypothetical protein ACE1TI_08680 [Alteribacillus sp. JSM 102045]|uniref:hypothetical protein n=1 Tax=Alteribacillus sp. JSM 102045 TaxID=1562101 RepID=UPI0035C14E93